MPDCPHCKDNEARATSAEKALADFKEAVQKEKGDLEQQIVTLGNSLQFPPVAEFIQHCEDGECGELNHTEDWAKYKKGLIQQAQDSIPDEVLREKAKKLNPPASPAPKILKIRRG